MTADPTKVPGIQLYEFAPDAPSGTDVPAQTVVSPVAATVGVVFTATVTTAALLHPLASVPVTVYDVVDVGITVTATPVSDPGIHV